MSTSSEADLHSAMRDESKRIIIDSLYTARGHQTAGLRLSKWNTTLGVPATILTAVLSSAAGLTALVGEGKGLTAFLALLSAAITSVRAFLSPDKLAESHGLKGDRMLSLRNDVMFFREVEMRGNHTAQELETRLRNLRSRYNDLNETAPRHIPNEDFVKARQSILDGQSDYLNDPLWEKLGD